jgi:uncharacterized protein (DUF1330 family)
MSTRGPICRSMAISATAGAVNFRTREVVKEGVVQSAGGQFNTQRHLFMFSPTKDQVRTLFAAEGYYTDDARFRTAIDIFAATYSGRPR